MFTPPLLVFAWMLNRIPAPTEADVAARSERTPMSGVERRSFFRRYAPGLVLLVTVYLLITVLRSVRADFAPEVWRGLQGEVPAGTFARSEAAVGLGVILLSGSAVLIRDNRRAFGYAMVLSVAGALLMAAALVCQGRGLISPFSFMVLHGMGMYLPYIAVHTTILERLIAMTRDRGNMGYLMYLCDSFGYLGYVGVLLARQAVSPEGDFLKHFVGLSWVVLTASVVLLIPCWRYFLRHEATRRVSVLGGVG